MIKTKNADQYHFNNRITKSFISGVLISVHQKTVIFGFKPSAVSIQLSAKSY